MSPTPEQLTEMAYLLKVVPRGEVVQLGWMEHLKRQYLAALAVAPEKQCMDAVLMDLEAAEQTIEMIATRVHQVGDMLEPIDSITKASARAKQVLPRIKRAIKALEDALPSPV